MNYTILYCNGTVQQPKQNYREICFGRIRGNFPHITLLEIELNEIKLDLLKIYVFAQSILSGEGIVPWIFLYYIKDLAILSISLREKLHYIIQLMTA